jgi:hypothetical protein
VPYKNRNAFARHVWGAVLVACLGPGAGLQAAETGSATVAVQAADVRYVWANSLTLRSAADGKSKALSKLPLGTQVSLLPDTGSPVRYQETLMRLAASADSRAADVVLDGRWVRVRAQDMEGWVVDVYLSRYPAPTATQATEAEPDLESAHAKALFGTKNAYSWKGTDKKTGLSYQALKKKHPELGKDMSSEEFIWNYVEFKGSGTYEQLDSRPGGEAYQSTTDIKDAALSFNEAVLWGLQFGYFAAIGAESKSSIGKFSGKFVPGRQLEVGPADDDSSGFGFARSITCSAKTCSLHQSFID